MFKRLDDYTDKCAGCRHYKAKHTPDGDEIPAGVCEKKSQVKLYIVPASRKKCSRYC